VRAGVFPGSFNPPTRAHLAIAASAHDRCRLGRVDLAVSRVALAKEDVERPRLDHRLAVLDRMAQSRSWLGVVLTEDQLLADIATGYDVLVLGADKWAQIQDPAFYGGSVAARDEALARLPAVAVAPRPSHPGLVAPGAVVLEYPAHLAAASSTAARAGDRSWMVAEALAFDEQTGAWTDPLRYERWLASLTAG
jgi:hypothetical protein